MSVFRLQYLVVLTPSKYPCYGLHLKMPTFFPHLVNGSPSRHLTNVFLYSLPPKCHIACFLILPALPILHTCFSSRHCRPGHDVSTHYNSSTGFYPMQPSTIFILSLSSLYLSLYCFLSLFRIYVAVVHFWRIYCSLFVTTPSSLNSKLQSHSFFFPFCVHLAINSCLLSQCMTWDWNHPQWRIPTQNVQSRD